MNRLDKLFQQKTSGILNIYCTAGFPNRDSLLEILPALQSAGADIIEIGMPYSDPVADGPVIQQSNMTALQNGMTIDLLFSQLESLRSELNIPLVLMGYINPVLQFGVEKFCEKAAATGISALILPDLPLYEYEKNYKKIFEHYGLHNIFLVSPQTSDERIKQADKLSNGFLYAVSSSATTGVENSNPDKTKYFKKISHMKLRNPVLIGFGIRDRAGYEEAATYCAGAIIGTVYIRHIAHSKAISEDTASFVRSIRGN